MDFSEVCVALNGAPTPDCALRCTLMQETDQHWRSMLEQQRRMNVEAALSGKWGQPYRCRPIARVSALAHDYCVHPAALDDVARRLRLRFERAGGHAAPGLAVAEAEQSVSIGCEPRLRFGSQDWRLLRTDSGRPRQPKLQH